MNTKASNDVWRAPRGDSPVLCPPVALCDYSDAPRSHGFKELSCGFGSIPLRCWFVQKVCLAKHKNNQSTNQKEKNKKHEKEKKKLWRTQSSLLFYFSWGIAPCYPLVRSWTVSSARSIAVFPLAGACGMNTKVCTHSQHQIWLFPTTPVIPQPQGLEDTSVSRCSSCHLHELHYLTALALINICCNLW